MLLLNRQCVRESTEVMAENKEGKTRKSDLWGMQGGVECKPCGDGQSVSVADVPPVAFFSFLLCVSFGRRRVGLCANHIPGV